MMPTGSRVRIYGILPAAGMSRRMGAPKQSMPVGETTMAGRTVQTMLAAGLDAVMVVTRTELVKAIDLPHDDRLLVVVNDDSSSQMLDSIRLGLCRLDDIFGLSMNNTSPPSNTIHPASAGILVIPADMPTVPLDACKRCIEAFQKSPANIFIATCNGKRGHPILFPAALGKMLGEMTGGLNALPRLRSNLVREIAIDNPAILRDVDTQADYDKL